MNEPCMIPASDIVDFRPKSIRLRDGRRLLVDILSARSQNDSVQDYRKFIDWYENFIRTQCLDGYTQAESDVGKQRVTGELRWGETVDIHRARDRLKGTIWWDLRGDMELTKPKNGRRAIKRIDVFNLVLIANYVLPSLQPGLRPANPAEIGEILESGILGDDLGRRNVFLPGLVLWGPKFPPDSDYDPGHYQLVEFNVHSIRYDLETALDDPQDFPYVIPIGSLGIETDGGAPLVGLGVPRSSLWKLNINDTDSLIGSASIDIYHSREDLRRSVGHDKLRFYCETPSQSPLTALYVHTDESDARVLMYEDRLTLDHAYYDQKMIVVLDTL